MNLDFFEYFVLSKINKSTELVLATTNYFHDFLSHRSSKMIEHYQPIDTVWNTHLIKKNDYHVILEYQHNVKRNKLFPIIHSTYKNIHNWLLNNPTFDVQVIANYPTYAVIGNMFSHMLSKNDINEYLNYCQNMTTNAKCFSRFYKDKYIELNVNLCDNLPYLLHTPITIEFFEQVLKDETYPEVKQYVYNVCLMTDQYHIVRLFHHHFLNVDEQILTWVIHRCHVMTICELLKTDQRYVILLLLRLNKIMKQVLCNDLHVLSDRDFLFP